MAPSSPSSAPSAAAKPRRPRLLGSTTPRVYTPPLAAGPAGPCGCGCALTPETSAGFEAIEFAEGVLDLKLLPWQRWLLIHALELIGDGSFRFRTIVLLVGRQNGKSTALQLLSLWMMYVLGVKLIIGTAQNLDVAEEQWEGAVEIAEELDELKAEIAKVSRVNGKKFLKLSGGERYKVAAASRRGGRGLSGDLVLLDELREHQSWDAWAAVTKTTMARARAQVWAASNAGDAASVVLRFLRKMAHTELGDPDGLADLDDVDSAPDIELDEDDLGDDTLGIFEWSAAPGCSIRDRTGWAQANPALGYTISEKAIAAAARTDPEWVFRTEVLCQWMDGTADGPFPPGSWEACRDSDSTIADGSKIAACVDVSWDRSTAHIAVAGWRSDGLPHVEIVTSDAGVDWVSDWLTDPAHPHRAKWSVAVQAKRAPASSLIVPLTDAGLDVVAWDGVSGTDALYDRVRAAINEGSGGPAMRHRIQPLLDTAAANAATRPVGDAWAWDRRKSPVDIAPLVAATGALWCLAGREPERKPEPRIRRLGG